MNCKKCGEPLAYSGVGRPPKYHPECSTRARRGVERESIASSPQDDAARRTIRQAAAIQAGLSARASKSTLSAVDASAMEFLAIGLGINADPTIAATHVGLDRTPEDLQRMAKHARRHLKGLVNADPSTISEIIRQGLAVIALRFRAGAIAMNAKDAAVAGRHMVELLKTISGGVAPTYGTIELEVPDPARPILERVK